MHTMNGPLYAAKASSVLKDIPSCQKYVAVLSPELAASIPYELCYPYHRDWDTDTDTDTHPEMAGPHVHGLSQSFGSQLVQASPWPLVSSYVLICCAFGASSLFSASTSNLVVFSTVSLIGLIIAL